MNKFKDKTILITGSARGIGFGIAKAFAEEGADLVLTDIRENILQQAKEELEAKYGVSVLAQKADGSDEKAVESVIQNTIQKFGRLNVVINNAQASKSGFAFMEQTKDDLNLALSSGLYSAFFYMQKAFPYLKKSQGSVINFASSAGMCGQPGQSTYAASKEAIRGMSRCIAAEWGPYNINVNIVCPLAMTEHLKSWKAEHPDLYSKTIHDIPLNRFGDPKDDIGRVCTFLASEDANYITGETISVQGGIGLHA